MNAEAGARTGLGVGGFLITTGEVTHSNSEAAHSSPESSLKQLGSGLGLASGLGLVLRFRTKLGWDLLQTALIPGKG